MSYAPVLFLSALTGQRVNTVLDAVKAAYAQYCQTRPHRRSQRSAGRCADQPAASRFRRPPLEDLLRYPAERRARLPSCLFVNNEELMHFAYRALSGKPLPQVLRLRGHSHPLHPAGKEAGRQELTKRLKNAYMLFRQTAHTVPKERMGWYARFSHGSGHGKRGGGERTAGGRQHERPPDRRREADADRDPVPQGGGGAAAARGRIHHAGMPGTVPMRSAGAANAASA